MKEMDGMNTWRAIVTIKLVDGVVMGHDQLKYIGSVEIHYSIPLNQSYDWSSGIN